MPKAKHVKPICPSKQATKPEKGKTTKQKPERQNWGKTRAVTAFARSHHNILKSLICSSTVDAQAAAAVDRLLAADGTKRNGATIKSLTLAAHIVAKRATFAVACETMKHLPVLRQLVDATDLLNKTSKLTEGMAYVLTYECLFGEGFRRRGPAENAVLRHKEGMQDALKQLLQEAHVQSVRELLPAHDGDVLRARPRHARVNTLRLSVAQALELLRSRPEDAAFAQQVHVDPLLPDVLVFPAGTELHSHPSVKNGSLILQSKASCMPAHALRPEPGWHVVDCCAAPGNKTTHVAAMLGNKGRVFAFDKDGSRLERLRRNAELAGASAITAQHDDFLSINTSDPQFAEVRGVILDPSCSGSGTVLSRMDHLMPSFNQDSGAELQGEEARRVEQLARFQRLAYSTCSLHERENEGVVAAVLPQAQQLGFHLVDPFPTWHRRGLPRFEGCEKLVRTDPVEDGTDGFFVAVFERQPASASHTQAGAPSTSAQPAQDRSPESATAACEEAASLDANLKPRSKKRRVLDTACTTPAGGPAVVCAVSAVGTQLPIGSGGAQAKKRKKRSGAGVRGGSERAMTTASWEG